jgi:hypothetical protein
LNMLLFLAENETAAAKFSGDSSSNWTEREKQHNFDCITLSRAMTINF